MYVRILASFGPYDAGQLVDAGAATARGWLDAGLAELLDQRGAPRETAMLEPEETTMLAPARPRRRGVTRGRGAE